jgi:hypothetical protein
MIKEHENLVFKTALTNSLLMLVCVTLVYCTHINILIPLEMNPVFRLDSEKKKDCKFQMQSFRICIVLSSSLLLFYL